MSSGISQKETARLNDPKLRPQINRATQENYAPGSIFKTIIALAALENGLNPDEIYHVQPNPEDPGTDAFTSARRNINDTAPPGDYNFKRAFIQFQQFVFHHRRPAHRHRENCPHRRRNFISASAPVCQRGRKPAAIFPTLEHVRKPDWRDGDTANVCIGQGEVDVTPMQMAVA